LIPVLLTSIPPALRGIAFSESGIGSLQQVAISSWAAAGLKIVSMHTSSELGRHPDHMIALRKYGIEILEVPPTRGRYPDYLPNFMSGCMGLLSRHPGKAVVVTNADIVFSDPRHINNLLSSLGDNNFVLSHRFDIEAISGPPLAGVPYCYGFDFFAASSTVLERSMNFLPSILTFGLPWWDLYLPLAMVAAGAKPVLDCPNYYLHLLHHERWSVDYWYQIGSNADAEFLRLSAKSTVDTQVFDWSLQRRLAIGIQFFSPKFFYKVKVRARDLIVNRKLRPLHLNDLANAIIDLILANSIGINPNG